ncbi:hypothetical protein MBLNU13_g05432t1 [Cladosporium sp. NU13]
MATPPKSSPPQDWVSPNYHLPTPTLDLDFRISCQLNPIIRVGEGPWGQRNWISFKGGEWTAKWGRGTIEPGGQDSQLVLPSSLHTFVSTNYLLRTDDSSPAFITVQTTGWRTGPREVMERLFDPAQADGVDPSEYSFRLSIKLETGDERYAGIVNSGMWIGSGARKGSEVIYDAYRVN